MLDPACRGERELSAALHMVIAVTNVLEAIWPDPAKHTSDVSHDLLAIDELASQHSAGDASERCIQRSEMT